MAGGRIRGITIEIEGNATPLNKALKSVDKQLSTTQRNLKDVNKLLKLDPGNTDLLKQKQKALADAVDLTKDRLKELNKAQSQLSEGTSEWDSLQREIIDTENNLKDLEKEYKEFGSVGAQKIKVVGDKMTALGEGMKDVGGKLTKYVTGPIVALGAGSMAAWNEVDDALDTVTKKTGATGEALEEMHNQVRDIATSMPTSFEEAGVAVGEVNTRFGLTGDALQELSEDFLKFASINDTDVNNSIDTIQSAMAAFNTETEKAPEVLDLFTAAGQQTGVPIEQLAESLKKNSTALQEMGFGLEDSVMFLAQLDKSGADSQTVLAGLKGALKNATKEGKPMSEALSDMQEKLKGAASDTEAAQLATELFGSKAGAAIAEYVRNGQLDFESLGVSLEDYAGLVDQTFTDTQDPIDDFQTTMNELKDLGFEIAQDVMPVVKDVLTQLKDIIEQLKEKWEGLSPEQQQMVEKFVLIAAVAGPVLSALGTLLGIIGSLMTIVPLIVGAVGPVIALGGPIIAMIAAVIAIGVLLGQHWDQVCEWANNLKEKVAGAIEGMKQRVTDTIEGVKAKFTEMKDKVSNIMAMVKEDISNKIEAAKQKVSDVVDRIKSILSFDGLKDKVLGVFDSIKQGISDRLDAAKQLVSDAVDRIKSLFNFDWHLPDLKLPHINVGGYINVPVLGTIPDPRTLSVDWYKKAYDNPIMFTKPTVLQTPSGLKGFGDGNGAEVVLSADRLRSIAGGTNVNINVYGAEGQSVDALAQAVQQKFVQWQKQEEAVYA